MARVDGPQAGADAGRLSVEGTLLRAALLAGHGAGAAGLARRLAAATRRGDARSCLEAGSPLQLTVDAPGPRGLRVGVRLGDGVRSEALRELMPAARRRCLEAALGRLPPARHPTLGTWLFWTERRQSLFVDLRDPRPDTALQRLRAGLDPRLADRLEQVALTRLGCRPWALRLEAGEREIERLHVHWLLGRHTDAAAVADAVAPGRWPKVVEILAHLLRRPGASGRWTIVTPLDERSEPALRMGNSAWTLVPEDDRKHRAVGRLFGALGGERDYAEALWSFCHRSAGNRGRVGRACEVRVSDGGTRARLFLSPRTEGPPGPQEGATAGTSSSEPDSSRASPPLAEPSSA